MKYNRTSIFLIWVLVFTPVLQIVGFHGIYYFFSKNENHFWFSLAYITRHSFPIIITLLSLIFAISALKEMKVTGKKRRLISTFSIWVLVFAPTLIFARHYISYINFQSAYAYYFVSYFLVPGFMVVIPFLTLILASSALKEIKITGEKGRSIIWITIIVSVIWLALTVIFFYTYLLNPCGNNRCKSSDAKIFSQLAGLSASAKYYFDDNGSYGIVAYNCNVPGSMFTDQGLQMVKYTNVKNYPNSKKITISCVSTGSTYAVSVSPLNKFKAWCVDSAGNRKQAHVDPITGLCGPKI